MDRAHRSWWQRFWSDWKVRRELRRLCQRPPHHSH